METWKPVLGYEKFYEVSSEGRVKSLPRAVVKADGTIQHRSERIKKPCLDSDGYYRVGICVDGSNIKRPVHILVAQAFVDGWFAGAEVNHIDCDRTNNNAENLEWVSHEDNIKHMIKSGRHITQKICYKGANNPNYGNNKLKNKYASDREYALLKQSRGGSLNGRAKAVLMDHERLGVIEFGCLRECADYLISGGYIRCKSRDVAASKIASSIKRGIPFCGATFKFI